MKAWKRLIALVALVAAVTLAMLFGCADKTSKPAPQPTPEVPKPPAEIEYDYVITGTRDIYVSSSATAASLDLSGIYATRLNGDGKYDVSADFSAVEFGTKGKYTAVYSCGNSKIEKYVFVYDKTLPVIAGAVSKTVSRGANPLDGVSATDQFGFSVVVSYSIEVGGVKVSELQTGRNDVTYVASDLAGNAARVTVALNVA